MKYGVWNMRGELIVNLRFRFYILHQIWINPICFGHFGKQLSLRFQISNNYRYYPDNPYYKDKDNKGNKTENKIQYCENYACCCQSHCVRFK
jgi:hypothetical protein